MKLVLLTITSRNIQEWVWNVETDCFIAEVQAAGEHLCFYVQTPQIGFSLNFCFNLFLTQWF
jgi:hypothetical protein